MLAHAATLAALALALATCACRPRPALDLDRITAASWPEADALFHADPRWLGADDAYSIDLAPLGPAGAGRVVWLFADTFIATSAAGIRAESRIVRNSVALQTGADPTTASIAFAWNDDGAEPASFFAEDGDVWYWPGDGVLVGTRLLVFLMAVRSSPGGLGFDVAGWEAALVDDPTLEPTSWSYTRVAAPQNVWGIIVGSASVLVDGDHLLGFSTRGPAQDVFLVRWPLASAEAGDLSAPEWRDGDAWVLQSSLAAAPAPLFGGAQTEFTVHRDPARGVWLAVQTVGFGATTIGLRTAPEPWGPWSAVGDVFRPPESDRGDTFVYAAKAHPELSPAGADLVLTYVANASDFGTLITDSTLYYPRFVRLTFER